MPLEGIEGPGHVVARSGTLVYERHGKTWTKFRWEWLMVRVHLHLPEDSGSNISLSEWLAQINQRPGRWHLRRNKFNPLQPKCLDWMYLKLMSNSRVIYWSSIRSLLTLLSENPQRKFVGEYLKRGRVWLVLCDWLLQNCSTASSLLLLKRQSNSLSAPMKTLCMIPSSVGEAKWIRKEIIQRLLSFSSLRQGSTFSLGWPGTCNLPASVFQVQWA